MTAPNLTPVEGFQSWIDHESVRGQRPPRWWRRRVWHPLYGWTTLVRARLAGPARMLPGLAAAVCAFTGSLLLWGLGVALLVAAGLLLLVDARTPAR